MAIKKLDHYLICSETPAKMEETKKFYERVLGLRNYPQRPKFNIPGYWLAGDDGQPLVHLISAQQGLSMANLEVLHQMPTQQTGAIDHIAFATDYNMEQKIHALNLDHMPVQRRPIGPDGVKQIFVWDPNGIKVELNFP